MRDVIRGLVCALAGVTTVAAAADRPVVGPVPDWVQPTASEIPPGPGSDAAVQVLLNDEQLRFSPTATEFYVDSRVRIQTPQGLQAVGTISLAWQPDADVITMHRLVVRRGGQVRDLLGSGDGFTVLRREDMLEQATLTGTLTAIMQPPDLQVGDIVEFAYTRRHADPVVPDKPDLQLAWLNAPIQNVRFRAQWPKQMAIRWQLRDFKPALQESSGGDSQSIAFTLENPAPLLQPAGAPARYAALRRVELTAFQSWPEVSRRLAPLYVEAAKLGADSPLHAEIDRIRKASADPRERAAAALRLAQEQVRYVLLAMNQGALVPATADQTWQRRYGDCKAKTALLLALLHELNIEAEPVTVNSVAGDGLDRLLPAISAFDHVLVRAQIAGKTYWLDGTRPADRRLDLLQTPFFGWGLPLTARGSELVRIQPEPRAEPEMLREVNLDASKGVDVPAQFRARAVFRGDGALTIKLSLDNADATQRDQGLRNYWRNEFDGLQVDKVDARFDETQGTMTWTAEGSLKLDWTDDGFYEIGDMNLGFKPDFSRPAGTDLEAPYAISFPEYSVNRISIKLPAGTSAFTISGQDIDRTLAGEEYRRKARIENSVFTAESSQRSLAPEITAQDAHDSEAGLREMYKNRLFVVKPRELPSAAELRLQAGKPLDTAGQYVDRAYDMMRRAMYEPAIAELDSALKLEPTNVAALGDRGLCYFHLRRFEEARADLGKALAVDPKNAVALRGLGAMAQDEGRTAEALDLLSRSLQIEESEWTRERRADLYLKNGDIPHAAQDLIAISRTDPARTSHFETRTMELSRQNRLNDIRALAKAALDAKAGPANGAVIAAWMYRWAGEDAQAQAVLEDAARKTPSADLYLNLARSEFDPRKSIALIERALNLEPKSVPALQLLATVQTALMNSDAFKTIDRMEAVAGPTLDSHLTRAVALTRFGQKERARESYAAARALARSSANFYSVCMSETGNGEFEDAAKDCEAALASDPACAGCFDGEGLALLKLERYEDAVATYDKVLALQPRRAASLFARGVAKLRVGRKEEGEADVAAALGMDPEVESRFAIYDIRR